mmetsp:Transcript_12322/g.34919  ORF Transcript_12322/g.34919 Transcript_12322/m.34919 type:complete len:257 (-) Transcript_12322:191-961(-)
MGTGLNMERRSWPGSSSFSEPGVSSRRPRVCRSAQGLLESPIDSSTVAPGSLASPRVAPASCSRSTALGEEQLDKEEQVLSLRLMKLCSETVEAEPRLQRPDWPPEASAYSSQQQSLPLPTGSSMERWAFTWPPVISNSCSPSCRSSSCSSISASLVIPLALCFTKSLTHSFKLSLAMSSHPSHGSPDKYSSRLLPSRTALAAGGLTGAGPPAEAQVASARMPVHGLSAPLAAKVLPSSSAGRLRRRPSQLSRSGV